MCVSAWRMAQWVKHLAHKHGDLRLDPQDTGKSRHGVCIWNPGFPMERWKTKTGHFPEALGQVSLVHVLMNKKSFPKVEREVGLYTYVHTQLENK